MDALHVSSHAPAIAGLGRKLKIEKSIVGALEHELGDVAAVQVEFLYGFRSMRGSQGTFVHRIVIFGDGRTPLYTCEEDGQTPVNIGGFAHSP